MWQNPHLAKASSRACGGPRFAVCSQRCEGVFDHQYIRVVSQAWKCPSVQVSEDSKDLGQLGSMSDSDSDYEGEQKELDLSNVSLASERLHLLSCIVNVAASTDLSICQMVCCMRLPHVGWIFQMAAIIMCANTCLLLIAVGCRYKVQSRC